MTKTVHIEICIDCPSAEAVATNVRAAHLGGADTIELCSAMQDGGLTPPASAITIARRIFTRPGLMVMIRPKSGSFVYTDAELSSMLHQIDAAATAKADGVVFGCLHPDGTIAHAQTARLIAHSNAQGLSTTFHRAFDACSDRQAGLQQLIALGVDRLLSSGTAWDSGDGALQGIGQLKQTIAQAGDKIAIVVGGGVTPLSAEKLLEQLAPLAQPITLHAYSSMLSAGNTSAAQVAHLRQVAQSHQSTQRSHQTAPSVSTL